MEEFKPNSHAFKEAAPKAKDEKKPHEKKVDKIISGTAKVHKKSSFESLKDSLINEDLPHLKTYILSEVLIPTIKRAISEIGHNAVDILLYGEANHSTRSGSSIGSRVSYRNYYDNGNTSNVRRDIPVSGRSSAAFGFEDIVLDNRGEAEDVLSQMQELISRYEVASVADLYDLLGITANYTDNRYGWENLSTAKIIAIRDGFLLKLPKPSPIN